MKRTHIFAAVAALSIPAPAFGGPSVKEQIFAPQLRGSPVVDITSRSSLFAGKTTIASGSASGTTSSTLCSTGWLMLTGQMAAGAANVASGTGIRHFEVKTICEGSFITFGSVDGQPLARDTDIHWVALRTS